MTKARSLRMLFLTAVLAAVSAGLTACNGPDGSPNSSRNSNADMLKPGTPDAPPAQSAPSVPSDPNLITIGVKYVALKLQASDAASPTQADVATLMTNMSKVWSQCDIRFVLEDYETPVAGDAGLAYNPANQWQLDADRAAYDDRKHALYVETGTWDRTGDLGNDGSNGFSTMPPANPEGTVFESWVATNTLLLSHETGHLLGGLDHTTDTTNLMNHFVTTDTVNLTQDQCNQARATIKQYHAAWMR